jgi:hypothetical protein
VCGRLAGPSGYARKDIKAPDILWACDRHIGYAKRVYQMTKKELTVYEAAAISRAKEAVVSALLEAVLSLMWERGIKSLDDIDGQTFAGLERVAKMDVNVQAAFTKFMSEYVSHLDKVMSGEEAPF